MRAIILGLMILMGTQGVFAEVTYEIKTAVTEEKEAKPVTNTTYTADIYVNGNLIASDVELANQTAAKTACQQFLTKWNEGRTDKVAAKDITDIKEGVK